MGNRMSTHPFSRYGGWAALAAGSLGIFATVCLILFFAVEAPLGSASPFPFGFFSDILPIFAAPLAVVVYIVFYQAQWQSAPQWSTAAAGLGITGSTALAVVHTLFVMERINLEEQIAGYFLSMVPLGLWHLLVNTQARRDGTLPARLASFGVLMGACQVLSFVFLFVLGGYNASSSADLAAITANLPLLIFLMIAYPVSVLGYIGPPIWLVWLGQVLIRENTRSETNHPPASVQG